MTPHIIRLDSCDSTNTVLGAMTDAEAGTVVATRSQTAGRGQRGNSWESEPGRNLTFSMLLTTGWPARRQFELSMLVALAIADSIDSILSRAALKCKVKWPNDIYVDDSKICGILIEHRLAGAYLERTIVGVGINVNQRHFISDAPNPVSVLNLLNHDAPDIDLDTMLEDVAERICRRVDGYCLSAGEAGVDAATLKAEYMSRLWRGDGREYPFALVDGSIFHAAIVDVAPDGVLTLSGDRRFAFKEVAFLLGY